MRDCLIAAVCQEIFTLNFLMHIRWRQNTI